MEGSSTGARRAHGVAPLTLLAVVVVVVAWGATRGLWPGNMHNGLLALSLTAVGTQVLVHRPGHREGRPLLAAGALEAVVYLGRQVGHDPGPTPSRAAEWLGWLGVWPVALALALTTLAVVCFPDGRPPSRHWRPVLAVVAVAAVASSLLSLGWPVEYDATGISTDHPLASAAPAGVTALWSALAHPSYVAFQLLWVVALAQRWRGADDLARRQVAVVAAAALVSVLLLLAGLAAFGTPLAGLAGVVLVPVAAGWAITRARHLASYTALSWLSRAAGPSETLPDELARATARALDARGAAVWMGAGDRLHAVGLWPTDAVERPCSIAELVARKDHAVRPVEVGGTVVGALSVGPLRASRLGTSDTRLLEDLAAQAGLVVAHLDLAELVARESRAATLDVLTARERDVLALMARGLSNAAVAEQLHLSIKTVEPVVGSIFAKLDLHADAASNRRVLAVLAYVRGAAAEHGAPVPPPSSED